MFIKALNDRGFFFIFLLLIGYIKTEKYEP